MLEILDIDLPDLPQAARPKPHEGLLSRMRESHHGVARLVASGKRGEEISQITAYSPAYISRLKADPAFCNLVEYYKVNVQECYYSAHERLGNLAADTVAEIHHRVLEAPDEFTPNQLIDLAKMALDRTGFGPTKTVNQTTLNAALTSEELLRIRAQAQQSGGIRHIGQENQTPPATDRGADGSPILSRTPLVHSEDSAEGLPSSWGAV